MAITVDVITDNQLARILTLTEGHFADLKGKEIRPSKLTNTISAFANADGGELFLGIAESTVPGSEHHWRGFADPEDANAHIQVFEGLFPLGEDFAYNFLSHPEHEGVVLQVVVHKTRGIITSNDGVPYLRRSAQNLPIDSAEKLALLQRNKGINSFEDEPVSTSLDTVCNSRTVLRFVLDVVPTREPQDWLKQNELIRKDKPTVAGVVLFADLPQAVLPKRTGIKIYRYRTSAEEGTRDTLAGLPLTIEGCAYDVITDAVRITSTLISEIRVMGTKGFESVEYPTETLHEVITNAVLHREYSIADDVHVRIFDNRVEVESPGRLPAHITAQNILSERFARNGNLVRVINKFPNPPNKDVGEGLNTAFQAMRNLRLKDPFIEERENSVVVQIKHEKLASAEDTIMEFLENNPEITNRQARELTGIRSENSMKGRLWKLRDRDLIEPVPGRSGFASAWRKKDKRDIS